MTDTPAAVTTTVAARTDLEPSPALSILANAKPTLEGRVIGCLISDGTDADLVLQVELAVTALKADFKIVAPKVGGATAADGRVLEVDFQLAGGSSVLFDHVFVVLSEGAAKLLSTEAAAVAWVHDAFQHLKVLGATDGAKALLDKAGVVSDEGVLIGSDLETYLGTAARGKVFAREPNVRTVF